ncbi:MAG TPA: arginase [Bacteroidales bacterium]|nr:arginase [Bacteroidales bacterium]
MELLDYLDPVELERPEEYFLQSEEILSKKIDVHTQSFELGNLSNYNIALVGIPEDRNSYNKGAALAPNKIRSELYKLISPELKTTIIDLGNIKAGNTYSDTYFALKDLVYMLLCENIIVVLLGGTQELTLPIFQAFENYQDKINLSAFDARIDSQKEALKSTSDSYLFELLLKKRKLFKFVHAGHQAYLTEKHSLELIQKLFHDAVRLGQIRNDLKMVEPILRDTDIVSFDIGCVRQSDAPGHYRPTPNGFYAEEACQIARYAGLGDMVRAFGVFEINSKLDVNNHTAALGAQMIWYFIDGVNCRTIETPSSEDSNFKTFIVSHNDLDFDMTFYKSMNTERWWLEIPNAQGKNAVVVPCAQDDYTTACSHEVPEIWWKNFQKLS